MVALEHAKTKMASSFKKKSGTSSSRSQAAPRGSKVSLHNNQLLVSSGVPSLDNILGKYVFAIDKDPRAAMGGERKNMIQTMATKFF